MECKGPETKSETIERRETRDELGLGVVGDSRQKEESEAGGGPGRRKRAGVAYKRKRKFAFPFRKPHKEAIYQKIDWIWTRFGPSISCLQEPRERI